MLRSLLPVRDGRLVSEVAALRVAISKVVPTLSRELDEVVLPELEISESDVNSKLVVGELYIEVSEVMLPSIVDELPIVVSVADDTVALVSVVADIVESVEALERVS